MLAAPDLKELERKAYRSYYYQDGMWDMYLGLILAWGYFVDLFLADQPAAIRYPIYGGVLLLIYLLFLAGKKWIVTPRVGVARFGQARRATKKTMIIILLFAALVNAALVLLTALGAEHLALRDLLAKSSYLLAISIGIWIALIMVVMGYMMDFERLMFYAIFIGVSITLMVILDTFLPFFITGFGIFMIGLVVFIRFLNRYPLPIEVNA